MQAPPASSALTGAAPPPTSRLSRRAQRQAGEIEHGLLRVLDRLRRQGRKLEAGDVLGEPSGQRGSDGALRRHGRAIRRQGQDGMRAVSPRMQILWRLSPPVAAACAALLLPVAAGAEPIPFPEITAALNSVHQFSQVARARRPALRLGRERRRPQLYPTGGGRASGRLALDHRVSRAPLRGERRGLVARRPQHRLRHQRRQGPDPDRRRGRRRRTGARAHPREGAALDAALVARRDADRVPVLARRAQGTQPAQPVDPDAGVVGSTIYEQRLALIPAAGGALRLLGPVDLNVYEYDWSPDGTRFAATAAHGNGDANWWIAQLYTIDAASGAARSIHKPELQIASPRWLGDGKRIAYIGGIMSDEAITGGDVFVVPASGGAATNVTPELKASVTTIAWNPATKQILTTELAGDRMTIATIDPDAPTHKQLWSAQEVIYANGLAGLAPGDAGVSLARDGKIAATIRQSITAPPEIAIGALGAMHNVTSANAHVRRMTGLARSLTWTSEGNPVQGWLIFPPDRKPGVKYPIMTYVHGGPAFAHYALYPSGPFAFQAALAARGYIVFEPNPRGSYGQGEAFTRANVKDFGYGDLRDILLGLDAVNQTIPVDPKKVGIFGWSYGGYMTMWAVTQTNRFKAAVSGAGLSDWLSYYGTNEIDTWMIPTSAPRSTTIPACTRRARRSTTSRRSRRRRSWSPATATPKSRSRNPTNTGTPYATSASRRSS